MRKFGVVLSAGVCVSLLVGCGMKPEKYYQNLRPNLLKGNYQSALDFLEGSKEKIYSKDNRLLFYMDKGMLLHLAKKYKESNVIMEQAKTAAEDLWTESIGKNAAAWVTTDNSLPYQGEDFEKVLLHFVAALNFMGLQDYGAARVEARQVTAKLELYNSKYTEGKNAYRDDGFARWLSGKLAETEGGQTALNDAWIDYKKAIEIYEQDYAGRYQTAVPRFLVMDALRASQALGADFKEEFQALKAKFPAVQFKAIAETKELGQVVFLHLSGESPYKIDKFWEARSDADIIRVAYPEYVPKPSMIVAAAIDVGGVSAQSEMGEPITAIAIQNLADHMGRIQAKAIARAIAKFIAAKAAQAGGKKVGGTGGAVLGLAGAVFEVANAVAEEADKRSWITLPAAVNVASVLAPAGQTEMKVTFLGAGGRPMRSAAVPVEVKAGQTTFVSLRTFE
jgi:uncharacterized protein